MSFDLGKIFKDLEVKYGDTLKDAFKSDWKNVTINVTYDTNDKDKKDDCSYCNCECDTCDCRDTCDCYDAYYEDVDNGIGVPVTKIEMGNLDPIVAENAVTADGLRALNDCCSYFDEDEDEDDDEDEVEEEPEVKLINVNKNVSKALETIYDVITEINDDGETYLEVDLVEEFPELFKNVREVTMEKVLTRIARHLSENGFDVETHNETNEYDNKVEKVYSVSISW